MPGLSAATFPNARILVVDDEPPNVRLLEILLRRAGYVDVTGTSTGRDVPAILASHGADIILLDLLMPDMSGYDLLAQIPRIVGPDTFLPIVVLTADVTPEARTRALELGAKDFLTKPFEQDEVLLRVANLLETRRLHLRLDDRIRAVVDGAPVILFATDTTGTITLATGAGLAAASLTPDDVLGRPFLDIATGDPTLPGVLARALTGEDTSTLARIGAEWCLIHGRPLREVGGQISGVLGVATIVTEQKDAEDALRSAKRSLEAIVAAAPLPMLSVRADGTVASWNPAAEHVFGWRADEVLDRPLPIVPGGGLPAHAIASEGPERRPATGRRRTRAGADVTGVRRDGTVRDLRFWIAPLDGTEAAAHMAIVEDVTDANRGARERSRLGAAVEQMVESVMFVDLAGLISYVNPAFERVSRWAESEVIGRHLRLVYEGATAGEGHYAIHVALDRGEPWEGDLQGRRRDDSRYTVRAIITPIRRPSGEVTEFVMVGRDVTRERELEADLDRQHRERAIVLAGLERLRPGSSVADTAASIVAEVSRLPYVEGATIVTLGGDGVATPIASLGRTRDDIAVGQPLGAVPAATLLDACARGPWIERVPLDDRILADPDGPVPGERAATLVWVPLRNDGRLLGSLVVAAREHAERVGETRILPAALEFGAIAGALLAPVLAYDRQSTAARGRIGGVIAANAFQPVFQPIVELEGRRVVGYEALTRFDDGTSPATWFGDAANAGVGLDLEVATLEAAIRASRHLPPDAWLSVNVSPAFVIERERLANLLAGLDRPIVLEITEHVAIPDYRAVREAVAGLDRGIRLAVDDAGAGFASLRHILELRPSLVKLDIDLVRDIALDPARQALVAGMRHFASTAGMRLLAEGIETPAQVEALHRLSVELGQGYLLGRPAQVTPAANPNLTLRRGGGRGAGRAAR